MISAGERSIQGASARMPRQDLLVRLETQDPLGGTDAQQGEARRVGGADRHALLEPFVQDDIVRRADVDPPAAAMSDGAGRLEQQQALCRRRGEGAPAAGLLDEGFAGLAHALPRA